MPVLGQVERGASIDLTWGRFWDNFKVERGARLTPGGRRDKEMGGDNAWGSPYLKNILRMRYENLKCWEFIE
ncbi:hypothetical protein TNCV_941601 [Trichonephila clavipes]|nr:hypothetical protein TNCV_941601 [Trichonephila clavipes]